MLSVSPFSSRGSLSADNCSTRDDSWTTSTPICSFNLSHSWVLSSNCAWRRPNSASCWPLKVLNSTCDSSNLNFNSSISVSRSVFAVSSCRILSCRVSFMSSICFLCSLSKASFWETISLSCWVWRSAWKALSKISWSLSVSISFSYSSLSCSFSFCTSWMSSLTFFNCVWYCSDNLNSNSIKSALCFSTREFVSLLISFSSFSLVSTFSTKSCFSFS